jgi:hypothetical protein
MTGTRARAATPRWRRWPACALKSRAAGSPPRCPARSPTARRPAGRLGAGGAAHGLTPRARITTCRCGGADPVLMLTAPIPATALRAGRAGLSIDDIDLIEINEAFASVVLAWQARPAPTRPGVNVNGGAIALGHPLGATGARLMTTLLHELERTGGRYGLQTMCEGGGQANVTIIERAGVRAGRRRGDPGQPVLRRGPRDCLSLARADLSRGPAALVGRGPGPGRHRGHDEEIRRRAGAAGHPGSARHARAVRADYVRPDAAAAARGPGPLRHFQPAGRHPRRGAVPGRGQAADDRLVGAPSWWSTTRAPSPTA